ncbi:MFS transporter [Aminipila luticellarii]|uniref:MFS transporter n=1 Tax=Aminipila luticellarii TaxID=2507160 RepID=A0A410PYT1_9FIRM|nr:MFS transporter [Aminipila luticellarii]QAT43996.1 MFS transporter [Aminipila luticellarii]
MNKITKFSAFAILMVPMVWNFEAATVGPALGSLMQAFPNEPALKIQLISTLPFLASVIFSVISGKLANFFDKKNIAVIGLLIYGITGITPAFVNSVNTILILRLLTGVGVGLVLPLPNQIIVEHYEGRERERMLGLATSTFNFANVVISILVGILLVRGWQMAFYSFSFIFVVLLIVAIGLPKSPPIKTDERNNEVREKVKLPKYVYAMALAMTLVWIAFGGFQLTISMFVTKERLAPIYMMGIFLAAPAFGSILTGIIFSKLNNWLKQYYVFSAMLCYAAGFICMYLSQEATLIIIGTLLIGIGSGAMVPYISNLTAIHVNEKQKDLAFGIVTACIHLGGLVSAFILSFIMQLGHATSYRFIYITYAIALILVGVVSLIINTKKRKVSA